MILSEERTSYRRGRVALRFVPVSTEKGPDTFSPLRPVSRSTFIIQP